MYGKFIHSLPGVLSVVDGLSAFRSVRFGRLYSILNMQASYFYIKKETVEIRVIIIDVVSSRAGKVMALLIMFVMKLTFEKCSQTTLSLINSNLRENYELQ